MPVHSFIYWDYDNLLFTMLQELWLTFVVGLVKFTTAPHDAFTDSVDVINLQSVYKREGVWQYI